MSIEGSTIKETLMRSVVEAVGEDLFENEILTKLMEEEDSTVVLQKGFVKSHFSNQHKYYQFQWLLEIAFSQFGLRRIQYILKWMVLKWKTVVKIR